MSQSDDPEFQPVEEYVPIPECFHSFLQDGLFTHCSMCEGYLLNDGTPYLIEKAIERDEVTFEYALCFRCQAVLAEDYSEGSLRVLSQFFAEHVKADRKKSLLDAHGLVVEPWIADCVICQAGWNGASWKQLIALCDGPDLLFHDAFPIMLCGREVERIYHLLSKKTKDRLDDFFDEVIGRPTDTVNLPVLL
ncbi:MAG: hypothetical protein AAF191_01380 [Verrucomicrobiota bacterium]